MEHSVINNLHLYCSSFLKYGPFKRLPTFVDTILLSYNLKKKNFVRNNHKNSHSTIGSKGECETVKKHIHNNIIEMCYCFKLGF